MRKLLLLFLIIILFIGLPGCGKTTPKEGIKEISLKELEKKFDNNETFLLMTNVLDNEQVKKRQIIEAVDDSLKRSGYLGFYVSLHGISENEINELREKYSSPKSDGSWDPDEDGLVLVENGSVIDETASELTQTNINIWVGNGWIDEDGPLDKDWFDDDLKEILEYMQFFNIELTANE